MLGNCWGNSNMILKEERILQDSLIFCKEVCSGPILDDWRHEENISLPSDDEGPSKFLNSKTGLFGKNSKGPFTNSVSKCIFMNSGNPFRSKVIYNRIPSLMLDLKLGKPQSRSGLREKYKGIIKYGVMHNSEVRKFNYKTRSISPIRESLLTLHKNMEKGFLIPRFKSFSLALRRPREKTLETTLKIKGHRLDKKAAAIALEIESPTTPTFPLQFPGKSSPPRKNE